MRALPRPAIMVLVLHGVESSRLLRASIGCFGGRPHLSLVAVVRGADVRAGVRVWDKYLAREANVVRRDSRTGVKVNALCRAQGSPPKAALSCGGEA
jgi:hypothetical protein